MKLSAYTAQALAPTFFRGAACPAAPTGHVLKLYSTAVTEAGGGTELAGNGYAPIALTGLLGAPQASGADYVVSNTARIESAEATGAWANAIAWGIFDGSGNMLVYGAVTNVQGIGAGEKWICDAGDLEITADGSLSAPGKQALLNWLFHGATFTPTTAELLALYDGAGTEIAAVGYSRQALALGALQDDGAGGAYYANTNTIEMTPAADWGTVGQVGYLTSAGVVIMKGAATNPGAYPTGKIFQVAVGGLTAKLQ